MSDPPAQMADFKPLIYTACSPQGLHLPLAYHQQLLSEFAITLPSKIALVSFSAKSMLQHQRVCNIAFGYMTDCLKCCQPLIIFSHSSFLLTCYCNLLNSQENPKLHVAVQLHGGMICQQDTNDKYCVLVVADMHKADLASAPANAVNLHITTVDHILVSLLCNTLSKWQFLLKCL